MTAPRRRRLEVSIAEPRDGRGRGPFSDLTQRRIVQHAHIRDEPRAVNTKCNERGRRLLNRCGRDDGNKEQNRGAE